MPDGHRQAVGRLLVPGDLLDRSDPLLVEERRPREQDDEGDLTVVEAVEVLGRRDLEVVRQRDGDIELDRPGERRDHLRHVGELHGFIVSRPAGALAEQVADPTGLGVVVAALERLDAELDPERDAPDRLPGGLGDLEPEDQGRGHGVGVAAGVDAVEDKLAHAGPPFRAGATDRLRVRRCSKKPSMASHASCPPSKPFQFIRTWPTSS